MKYYIGFYVDYPNISMSILKEDGTQDFVCTACLGNDELKAVRAIEGYLLSQGYKSHTLSKAIVSRSAEHLNHNLVGQLAYMMYVFTGEFIEVRVDALNDVRHMIQGFGVDMDVKHDELSEAVSTMLYGPSVYPDNYISSCIAALALKESV